MNNNLARLISGLTSPFLVIGVFGVWTIAVVAPTLSDALLYISLFGICIIFLPFLYIFIQVRRGLISDMHVAVREQRILPFVLASIGASMLVWSYLLVQAPQELVVVAIAVLVSGILFGLITHVWKISIHAAAFAGSVIVVSELIHIELLWLLLILPAIMWARYTRKRHSILQGCAAIVLVTVCVAATFQLLL